MLVLTREQAMALLWLLKLQRDMVSTVCVYVPADSLLMTYHLPISFIEGCVYSMGSLFSLFPSIAVTGILPLLFFGTVI